MRRILCVGLVCAAAVALGSCKRKTGPVVGVAFDTLQTAYWVASIDKMKREIEKNGATMRQAVANNDENLQREQVNNFVALKLDGIIVAPKDAQVATAMVEQANKANIPIVFYNRPPAESPGKYVAIVADNRKIARETVEYMCQKARERGGKFKAAVLVGHLGDINAIGRLEGFRDAVSNPAHKDLFTKVIEVQTNWRQKEAMDNLKAALNTDPDINFIFSCSDFLFPSVISALGPERYRKIGETGHVILGGFDGDDTACQMLIDKYLDADGVQDMDFECEQAVKAIFDIKTGKEVPRTILDPGFVIHQGNFEQLRGRMWGANVPK